MKKLINLAPSPAIKWLLGLLPFLLLLILYVMASEARLEVNPADKLLPSFSSMQETMTRMAFEPDKRRGEYVFWVDTISSLKRLGTGVAIAAVLGMIIGILTGALPIVNASLTPLLTVISLIPCLALLPVLFIVVGLGRSPRSP